MGCCASTPTPAILSSRSIAFCANRAVCSASRRPAPVPRDCVWIRRSGTIMAKTNSINVQAMSISASVKPCRADRGEARVALVVAVLIVMGDPSERGDDSRLTDGQREQAARDLYGHDLVVRRRRGVLDDRGGPRARRARGEAGFRRIECRLERRVRREGLDRLDAIDCEIAGRGYHGPLGRRIHEPWDE